VNVADKNSDSEKARTAMRLFQYPDSKNIETALRWFRDGEYGVEELFQVFEFNYGSLSREERGVYYDIFAALEVCAAYNFRRGLENVRRLTDEYLSKSADQWRNS